MGWFIVRPIGRLIQRIANSIFSEPAKFNSDDRSRRVNNAVQAYQSDPVRKDIDKWISKRNIEVVASPMQGRSASATGSSTTLANVASANPSDPVLTPVTGSFVLKMSEDQAEKLRRDLPETFVIADRPLQAIVPRSRSSIALSAAALNGKRRQDHLWHLEAVGIHLPKSSRSRRGGSRPGNGIVVGVIDTGVDASHPELQGKISESVVLDGDAWVAQRDDEFTFRDPHGTHVAALIAGESVGVAPGARLVSAQLKPSADHDGGAPANAPQQHTYWLRSLLLGLEWAGSHPEVSIVNISAGLIGYVPEMQLSCSSLIQFGVLPVAAIGNEYRDHTRSPGNFRDVISVGAVRKYQPFRRTGRGRAARGQRYEVSPFSGSGTIVAENHMYTVPDLVAPGDGVVSAVPGKKYEAWSGTSMAAPIVAGLAARLLERHRDLNVQDLAERLLGLAVPVRYDNDKVRQGFGMPIL